MRGRTIAIVMLSALLTSGNVAGAQETLRTMSLEEAIELAKSGSVEALAAKSAFISSYWAYRSYRAGMLPSLSLYGNLAQFNRSLTLLQDYDTGQIKYSSSNNLQNTLGLSLSQNLSFTGGTLTLYSDLGRTDQFGSDSYTAWLARPIRLYYEQPLLSYNSFKWDKEISPKEYEMAERVYIETLEEITVSAVKYFFSLMLCRRTYDTALSNYSNSSQMCRVAAERLKLGTVTRDEYLQLELSTIQDSIAINEAATAVREAQMTLNSLLGLDEKIEIRPVSGDVLPEIMMDYDVVLAKAMENSSFRLENDIKVLEAESAVAQARANRGATVAVSASFGLSNSNSIFKKSYQNLLDQEVFGITFSVPIFDWGLGKGRVKEAKAQADVVQAQVEQAESDYRREIFTAVGQFNSQRGQCKASERASVIAKERYTLVAERFRGGTATVTELIDAQEECDEAEENYINDLSDFWNYYYSIRQLALYDFIEGKEINVDFDALTQ